MNLVYLCVFLNKDQLEFLKLFLFSMILYSKLDSYDIIIITSPDFVEDINKISIDFNIELKILIVECKNLNDAQLSRFKIFNYPDIQKYEKILYMDTDILIQGNLEIIFNVDIEDKVYGIIENDRTIESFTHGGQLFDFTKVDRNIKGTNSGVLLFKNSETICNLFTEILNEKNINFNCLDQSLLNYYCIKSNLFGNNILMKYAYLANSLLYPVSPKNNNTIIINHFYGGGKIKKIDRMLAHFLHLLEVLNLNNNSPLSTRYKQFKWGKANVLFDDKNVLITTWGYGSYKTVNNYVYQLVWNNLNHTIIFNKDYTKFLSFSHTYKCFDTHLENMSIKNSIPEPSKLNLKNLIVSDNYLIYFSVFFDKGYLQLLKYFLVSLKLFSKLESVDLLILTSEDFRIDINKIAKELQLKIFIKTFNFNNMFEASAARLHIFEYENINHYNKILYLDTDIIIQGNIMKIFECLKEDKLYAVKENDINTSFNGAFFFDFNKFDINTPAFNAGVLLFKNSVNIRRVFCDINKHIENFKKVDSIQPPCLEQPFVVYHFIKNNLCDIEILSNYIYLASDTSPPTLESSIIVSHFLWPIGNYLHKLTRMKSHFSKLLDN